MFFNLWVLGSQDRLKIPAERRPKICPKIEKPQALRWSLWKVVQRYQIWEFFSRRFFEDMQKIKHILVKGDI